MELRQDGTLRRTGLRSLLPGGATTTTLARLRDGESAEDGFQVLSPPAWPSDDRIGVLHGHTGRRWRFLDGNEFWLSRAGPALGPAVIIDTGDSAFFGLKEFEERRLFSSDLVLVMPHTDHASTYIDSYHEWVGKGRLPQGLPTPQPWDPDAPPDPVQYARPIPVQADFTVTAVAQAGSWHDPSDLEAARSLLAARFDLRLGIWDPGPQPPSPPHPPRYPASLQASRSNRRSPGWRCAARRPAGDRELNDRATQDTVASQLGQLTAVGWQNLGRGMFRLPLTGSFSRWEGDEPEPLVFLTLLILKRQAYVYPHAAYYNHRDGDAARYVSEHQGLLERIAAPGELVMRPVQSVIWRERGGWADDI